MCWQTVHSQYTHSLSLTKSTHCVLSLHGPKSQVIFVLLTIFYFQRRTHTLPRLLLYLFPINFLHPQKLICLVCLYFDRHTHTHTAQGLMPPWGTIAVWPPTFPRILPCYQPLNYIFCSINAFHVTHSFADKCTYTWCHTVVVADQDWEEVQL